uniref:uncharacterized protein LOC129519823 n=1 Tax=Nyctereutes procyonoides TaxID=34880 RepID=UPI002443D935|nr:uncharacterized protein LOC129519823 [Nyctereutes procyonoides]
MEGVGGRGRVSRAGLRALASCYPAPSLCQLARPGSDRWCELVPPALTLPSGPSASSHPPCVAQSSGRAGQERRARVCASVCTHACATGASSALSASCRGLWASTGAGLPCPWATGAPHTGSSRRLSDRTWPVAGATAHRACRRVPWGRLDPLEPPGSPGAQMPQWEAAPAQALLTPACSKESASRLRVPGPASPPAAWDVLPPGVPSHRFTKYFHEPALEGLDDPASCGWTTFCSLLRHGRMT